MRTGDKRALEKGLGTGVTFHGKFGIARVMTPQAEHSQNMDAKVLLDSVSLRRGDRLLLEGLTLSLRSGELLYLTGQNGVGKTTLLLALAGFLKADAGHIKCETPALMHHPDGASKGLSVTEDLSFYATLHKRNIDVSASLEAVGLSEETQRLKTEDLSLGQRKRLNLAKIIIAQKHTWLLDEPFSALDETGQRFVEETLSKHLLSGGICVIATHLPRKIKDHHHKTLHLSQDQQ